MSFNSDMTDYKTTYERLEARKANDLIWFDLNSYILVTLI